MGSRISKSDNDASPEARVLRDNDCINEINNINENALDRSNIDKLQIKAIKHMTKELKELKDTKSDKIMYKLPAINLCSYSLI